MSIPDHDWEITNWEYDCTFFKCRVCHLKSHCGRGYPAISEKECMEAGIAPCRGPNRSTQAIENLRRK